jgi:hypothetical protein
MTTFRKFVESIHQAIMYANDSLMDKSADLLKKYFDEQPNATDPNHHHLMPKFIELSYPTLNDAGEAEMSTIQVPLIALSPIVTTKIEKATFTAEFEIKIVNDELEINFADKKSSKEKTASGKLEIIISPQEPEEGLNAILEGYINALKRQIM